VTIGVSRAVEKKLIRRAAAADSVFCFLDYDGTLSPLAPTPGEAVALPGTSALVRQLAAAAGVQVALISGRTIADMRRFLEIPGIYYVGVHGIEMRPPNGETQLADGIDAVRAALPEVKRRLGEGLGIRAGILIEDKGAALACHYRLAAPADAVAARKVVAGLVREQQAIGVPIALIYGQRVAELRPAQYNKGTAACGLLAACGRAALPLYIGDDQTDEDAFAALPPESITIQVAASAVRTQARYRVAGPRDVHRFLRGVLELRTQDVAAR
jgi:trehalose 6-phosphate phosphatase